MLNTLFHIICIKPKCDNQQHTNEIPSYSLYKQDIAIGQLQARDIIYNFAMR